MAARQTLLKKLRAEARQQNRHVLLLSGGDINTGVPESGLLKAEPDFKGMSLLGYDAMAIGNHEFDNPISIIRQQEKWSGVPFLAANIYDEKTHKRLFRPYLVKKIMGKKIYIIGLTTEDTKTLTHRENTKNIYFRPAVDEARELVPQIKNDADLIIFVTHMGHYDNGNHGTLAPGDVTLARQVPDIDIIVGGHSQDPLFTPDMVGKTAILQAYEWGKYVGKIDMAIIRGKMVVEDYKLIPVNLKKKVVASNGKEIYQNIEKEIPEDKMVYDFLHDYYKKGVALTEKVIGQTKAVINGDRQNVRSKQTDMGHLIAYAQRKKVGADIGIVNGGGIRAGLPAGNITYRDVLTVHPFGNTVCTVDLTGKELKEFFKQFLHITRPSGGYPQVSGAQVLFKGKKLVSLQVGGKEIQDQHVYKLAINNYLAAGGDLYPNLKGHPSYRDTGHVDASILRDFVLEYSPISMKGELTRGGITWK